MAIDTQTLGLNSWYVAYTSGESTENVKNAVHAVITAAGWTEHDSAAGVNKVCFKAPVANSTIFKYVVLDWSVSTEVSMWVYETWNATTHVGTNLAYVAGVATAVAARKQSIDLAGGGYVYIFAKSRYLVLLNRLVSNGGWGFSSNNSWTGCLEFALETGEAYDTYPNFAHASGLSINGDHQVPQAGKIRASNLGLPAADSTLAGAVVSFRYASVPRTTGGLVAASAELPINISVFGDRPTINGSNAYVQANSGNLGSTYFVNGVNVGSIVNPTGSSTWFWTILSRVMSSILPTGNNPNTNLPWCGTPVLLEMDSANFNNVKTIRGRIFGLKIAGMGKSWSMMDSITTKVDSDLFHTSAGSNHPHFYLGNNTIIPS